MCWSKLKTKVQSEDYIKPAIFETEWNRWYILMIAKGSIEVDEKMLAEERASNTPRAEFIKMLEADLKHSKAIIREREFYNRIAPINPLPWLFSKIFGI